MDWNPRPRLYLAGLLTLFFAAYLSANGQIWDFLGNTQIDGRLDHGKIEIGRRDHRFHAIQLRIRGDAIFFDHVLVHFDDGSCQNVAISGRISSEQKEYLISLPGEGRALDSVEFFYFKEPWQHNPSISLYGLRLPDSNADVEP